jgi:hypothetical protein
MRKVFHQSFFVATACLFGLLAACQSDPWASGFLTKQPLDKDVVGVYRVDSDSRQRAAHLKEFAGPNGLLKINQDAEIIIAADHSLKLVKVPSDNWTASKPIYGCLFSGSGAWKLGKSDNFWRVQPEIREGLADDCPSAPELNLFGNRPPYKLHITLGDPDAGDAVQFARISSP